MPNQGHAAMLQLIAEGIRSPASGGLSQEQLDGVAGLLDRIAVDLLVPVADDDDDVAAFNRREASLPLALDS